MTTFDIIRDIFYSGSNAFRGDNNLISEIAFLLDENYLSLSVINIASKRDHEILLNNPDKIRKQYDAAGGDIPHVALKLLARDYLRANLGIESVFEHLFCGYYPDVISNDESITIECGLTGNPDKMLAYFRQGNIKECIQIPYPFYGDTEIKGYSFTAKSGLKEFLIFLEKEKRNEVKKIFLNRK